MADKPFIFGEKSIRDNQDIINRLKALQSDELNIPGEEDLIQDKNGEGAKFTSPETGTTSTFYANGTRMSQSDMVPQDPTNVEQLKQVLANRKPSFNEKAELIMKLRKMGVALPKEVEDQALMNSMNNH